MGIVVGMWSLLLSTGRRPATVAWASLVPLDDAGRRPDVCATDGLVGRRHLAPGAVGGNGADHDAEVVGDIARRPPLGVRIGLAHDAHGTGSAAQPLCTKSVDNAQSLCNLTFADTPHGN